MKVPFINSKNHINTKTIMSLTICNLIYIYICFKFFSSSRKALPSHRLSFTICQLIKKYSMKFVIGHIFFSCLHGYFLPKYIKNKEWINIPYILEILWLSHCVILWKNPKMHSSERPFWTTLSVCQVWVAETPLWMVWWLTRSCDAKQTQNFCSVLLGRESRKDD